MPLNLDYVDHDWEEAFSFAADEGYVKVDPKTDIKRVIASIDGDRDGPDWQAVVELKKGGFLWISSGCDYSGWECRASGSAMYAKTLKKLFNPYNMPRHIREDFAPLLKERGIEVNLKI